MRNGALEVAGFALFFAVGCGSAQQGSTSSALHVNAYGWCHDYFQSSQGDWVTVDYQTRAVSRGSRFEASPIWFNITGNDLDASKHVLVELSDKVDLSGSVTTQEVVLSPAEFTRFTGSTGLITDLGDHQSVAVTIDGAMLTNPSDGSARFPFWFGAGYEGSGLSEPCPAF